MTTTQIYNSVAAHKNSGANQNNRANKSENDTPEPTITVDGREFTIFRTFFNSKDEAALAGYHPKSYWQKMGREIAGQGRPAVVAVKTWRTYNPHDKDLILAYSLMNEYFVTSKKFLPEKGLHGCWEVYPEDQTSLIKSASKYKISGRKQNKEKKTNITTTTTSITSSSCYGKTTDKSATKCIGNKDLERKSNETRLITIPQKKKTVEVFFPEGFQWEDYPTLEPYRSTVLWFFHKLHERRFLNLDGRIFTKDDYITINSKIAREITPNFSKVAKLLIEMDILERDYFERKTKSYGYRFANLQLRHATRRRTPLDDPKMAKRILKHRKSGITTQTGRWLYSQLLKLALEDCDTAFLNKVALISYRENGGSIGDKLEAYECILGKIADQEHYFTPDDQGRRYSLITNLKRELRSLLRVDGQLLQQIDICNSQWLFLAIEMRRQGIECSEYFDLCERGIMYERVAEHAKLTRKKVKKALTQRALFSSNDAPCQNSKIKKTFDRLFPEVAKFIQKMKRCGDGGELAKTLQAAEADLIIDRVCGRLRREERVRFVTSIHDSLLFLPEDGDYVRLVMLEEFKKLNVEPLLEVKDV